MATFYFIFKDKDYSKGKDPQWGVTVSTVYAKELGLNWVKVFHGAIDDLEVRLLRIPVYWQEVEKVPGEYDFSEIQYMLDEAQERGVRVLLVTGIRQPRWPECHYPKWLTDVSKEVLQENTLALVREELLAFDRHPAVIGWQVENEPLLTLFGRCPKPDKDFLKKEIDTVRSYSTKLILITDSGELSLWLRTGALTKVLGTTLYRVVWNPRVGFLHYDLIPPAIYFLKATLVKKLYPSLERVIISELQAEPWVPEQYGSIVNMPVSEQLVVWNLERFRDTIKYARRTGFDTVYLWGLEWWYWMKETQGHREYWDAAREVFLGN